MAGTVEVAASDGRAFDAFLYLAPKLPAPGLVMIPEIFGVNQPLREIARRYANVGYVVLVPDIFWRLERNVDLGYDKVSYKKAFDLHAAFDYDIGVEDMQRGIDVLRARPECTGSVGVVGFCLGGTMAYLAAARCDAEVAVGYYGTRIQNFLKDAQGIQRPLILHFGEVDHTTPPEVMAKIRPAIDLNQYITEYIYEGAGHAFANHRRVDTYKAGATQKADERTFAFLDKWLA